jgi:hypothetical protein
VAKDTVSREQGTRQASIGGVSARRQTHWIPEAAAFSAGANDARRDLDRHDPRLVRVLPNTPIRAMRETSSIRRGNPR